MIRPADLPEALIQPLEADQAAAAYADWTDLVDRIRSNAPGAIEDLYLLYARGIRFFLARHLSPASIDDRLHDVLLEVAEGIRKRQIVNSEYLLGAVRHIARLRAEQPRSSAPSDSTWVLGLHVTLSGGNPVHALEFRRKTELVDRVLLELSTRDREILMRLYLQEQGEEQICQEMGLTPAEFRSAKSAVKARFAQLVSGFGSILAALTNSSAISSVVPVIAHAIAVFGDEHKASHWLATPLSLLGGRAPSELLTSPEGIESVERILTRIEHNIPS